MTARKVIVLGAAVLLSMVGGPHRALAGVTVETICSPESEHHPHIGAYFANVSKFARKDQLEVIERLREAFSPPQGGPPTLAWIKELCSTPERDVKKFVANFSRQCSRACPSIVNSNRGVWGLSKAHCEDKTKACVPRIDDKLLVPYQHSCAYACASLTDRMNRVHDQSVKDDQACAQSPGDRKQAFGKRGVNKATDAVSAGADTADSAAGSASE